MKKRPTEEVEVKIRLQNPSAAERDLRRAGFRLAGGEMERDILLDTPEHSLRAGRRLLRIRRHAGKWLLTFKGTPADDQRYKAREEIETEVTDGEGLKLILERLGFRPVFAYEKRRRTFRRRGEPGLAALDHTPIGAYLELEGPRAWIDRTARRLGFGPEHYLVKSYAQLYLDHCRERGVEPTNMLFARASQ